MIFFVLTSFVYLWRSYFVLLPKERARVWGFGFRELSEEIKKRSGEKFMIDQARSKPAYIELAFFLRYPPETFHQEVDAGIKKNYYTDPSFNENYKFGNIETRTLNWEEDIYKEQILVGDDLAISDEQVNEHFLIKVFEIKDPLDSTIFVGYKTNPRQKCAKVLYKYPLCK